MPEVEEGDVIRYEAIKIEVPGRRRLPRSEDLL
jgi:hypothetical protein